MKMLVSTVALIQQLGTTAFLPGMALRTIEFDVEALGRTAAAASGGSNCNEVEFIGEGADIHPIHLYFCHGRPGTFNRVLRFGFEVGRDVVARTLSRNSGPRSLLTRSEVATMDFVRSRLGAPVPKVLAWDASKDNEVGCEYIIMEKCEGKMLATCWNDSLSDPRLHHVHDVAKMQTELSAIRFSQYGSIY